MRAVLWVAAHLQVRRHGCIDLVEEAPELHRAMPSAARANDLSGLHAVAAVIVGTALNLTGPHGQQRSRPLKGLDLRLLVDAQHQGSVGRMEVEPDDVADLLDEQRVGREFERLSPVWLEGKGAPDAGYGALAHTRLILIPLRRLTRPPSCQRRQASRVTVRSRGGDGWARGVRPSLVQSIPSRAASTSARGRCPPPRIQDP